MWGLLFALCLVAPTYAAVSAVPLFSAVLAPVPAALAHELAIEANRSVVEATLRDAKIPVLRNYEHSDIATIAQGTLALLYWNDKLVGLLVEEPAAAAGAIAQAVAANKTEWARPLAAGTLIVGADGTTLMLLNDNTLLAGLILPEVLEHATDKELFSTTKVQIL